MGTKVLEIGLDGATPELVDRWVAENKLPYLKQIMRKGVYGKLKSIHPPISPAACIGKFLEVVDGDTTVQNDREAMIALRRMSLKDVTSSDEDLGRGIRVVPNGVDLTYFQPLMQERRRLNLVFSGKMSYHADVATALYLCKQIMPLIWREQPGATLTIVGSNPPKPLESWQAIRAWK